MPQLAGQILDGREVPLDRLLGPKTYLKAFEWRIPLGLSGSKACVESKRGQKRLKRSREVLKSLEKKLTSWQMDVSVRTFLVAKRKDFQPGHMA